MPWTIDKVDEHKKGLTDEQKKKWVATVNSTLKSCMDKGGTEEEGAAKAIKIANGTVTGNMQVHSQKNKDYEIQTKEHQKKKYIVVPVVMMVEGVHNGSKGAVLHTAEEMSKITESWNGIPIVIDHPQDDGTNISANSPLVIDKQAVGRVYNTYMDGNKLMAEAWLDEEKLNEISPEAYAHIIEKKALEVSVGVFTEDEEEIGEYNNEHYEAIATNYRPDHLALLPGGVGACSWNDGCGIRANKEGGNNEMDILKTVINLNLAGYSILKIGNHAEQGYNEKLRLIYDAVRGLDGQNKSNYLEELFDDYLIYNQNINGEGKMFKQFYQIKDNIVEFVGYPVPIKRKVEYVVFERKDNFNNNVNKEDKKMPSEKECGQCMEKIVALIANSRTHFTEADREWLLTQDEAVLDKLMPKEPEKQTVQINKEQAIEVLKDTIKKPEDFINLLPDEMKDSMNSGLALHKEMRKNMIDGILVNTTDVWTKEELEKMNTNSLKKLHSSIKIEVVDYSLNGGNPILDNSMTEDDILPMPGVEIKK